jgi:hypothetical protein
MSLLGKVLPMTIGDTGKDVETRMVVENRIVWPEDKDRNIIRPITRADLLTRSDAPATPAS